MVCNVPLLRSSPYLGEVLHENQSNLHFEPQLLGSWAVMNSINGIARQLSIILCSCLTNSGPRGANAVGEEHLQTWHVLNVHKMCIVGERIQGLLI